MYSESELRKLYRELIFTRMLTGADYRSPSWARFHGLLRAEEERVQGVPQLDFRPQLGKPAEVPLADPREVLLSKLAAAEAHLASREFKQGEELFRDVCRSEQHLSVAVVGLAQCLLGDDRTGNHDAVVALLEHLLELSPSDVAAAELLRSVATKST